MLGPGVDSAAPSAPPRHCHVGERGPRGAGLSPTAPVQATPGDTQTQTHKVKKGRERLRGPRGQAGCPGEGGAESARSHRDEKRQKPRGGSPVCPRASPLTPRVPVRPRASLCVPVCPRASLHPPVSPRVPVCPRASPQKRFPRPAPRPRQFYLFPSVSAACLALDCAALSYRYCTRSSSLGRRVSVKRTWSCG